MGHSHSLPHLQCCSLAHGRLALEMASLQVKAASVQNRILSCQPTWTFAIKWKDTSFQDSQQFSQVSSRLNTHKPRERERDKHTGKKRASRTHSHHLSGLLKVSDFSFHVSLHWSLPSWISIWALRRLLWASQRTGAVFAVAQYLCLPAWRPETVSDLARWLPFCQIRVLDSSRIKPPCSNKQDGNPSAWLSNMAILCKPFLDLKKRWLIPSNHTCCNSSWNGYWIGWNFAKDDSVAIFIWGQNHLGYGSGSNTYLHLLGICSWYK